MFGFIQELKGQKNDIGSFITREREREKYNASREKKNFLKK